MLSIAYDIIYINIILNGVLFQMELTKRRFLKLLTLPSLMYLGKYYQTNIDDLLVHEEEFLIVNGWVMLKSDLNV